MTMQRYRGHPGAGYHNDEDENGDIVLWKDVEALLAENKALRVERDDYKKAFEDENGMHAAAVEERDEAQKHVERAHQRADGWRVKAEEALGALGDAADNGDVVNWRDVEALQVERAEFEREMCDLSNALGAVGLALMGEPIPEMSSYMEPARQVEVMRVEVKEIVAAWEKASANGVDDPWYGVLDRLRAILATPPAEPEVEVGEVGKGEGPDDRDRCPVPDGMSASDQPATSPATTPALNPGPDADVNRGTRECPQCDGKGYIALTIVDGFECGNCGGSGRVPIVYSTPGFLPSELGVAPNPPAVPGLHCPPLDEVHPPAVETDDDGEEA